MGQQVHTGIRHRIAALLNRPVLTESDKRTIRELKGRMFEELNTHVLNESDRKTISLQKARFVAWVNGRVFSDANKKRLYETRNNAVVKPIWRLLADANEKVFAGLKKRMLTDYAGFKLWLKTPATVSSFLVLTGFWAFTIFSVWAGVPWSYFGDVSGPAALIMTAIVTARLTLNSQKLWLGHLRLPTLGPNVEKRIIETESERRTVVLHQIEEFFGSGVGGGQMEINLKANAFLMRKSDWQSLQDALYDTFLRGAPPLLFELGHRLGSSVGRDLMKISRKPGRILAHLQEVSRALGWGILSVDGNLPRSAKLTFKVQESPFSVADSPLAKNADSCHLLTGLVAGISEELYGWPCSSFEQKCVRNGNDYCEIVVTQSTVPEKPKRRWNLSVIFPTLHPWIRN
jgi:predicted hydrocarbon binding protein